MDRFDFIQAQNIIVEENKVVSVLEFLDLFPFEIKRIYWVSNYSKELMYSAHAHKSLEQVIFCIRGKVEISIEGSTSNFKVIIEDNGCGVFVPKMHWKSIVYYGDSLILCFASQIFDEHDYIRDYNQYLNYIN